MSTDAWHDFIKEDEPLRLGIVHTNRLVTFGGGYPIKLDGDLIGAVGVSGGHYTHDIQVAGGALEAMGLSIAGLMIAMVRADGPALGPAYVTSGQLSECHR
jgi:uncharacterized protein GlcG (DUF336 family)